MTDEDLTASEHTRREQQLGELMTIINGEVQKDGGSAEVGSVDYRTGEVEVILSGACGSCSLTGATMEDGIKRILTQRLDWVTEVRGTVEESSEAGYGGWLPRAVG